MNRPARLPPCDGVLWPTGPDTSRSETDAGRRAGVGDTDLVGSDEAAKVHYATKSALAHRAGHIAKVTLRIQARGWTAMKTHVAGAVAPRSAPRRTSGYGLILDAVPAQERLSVERMG